VRLSHNKGITNPSLLYPLTTGEEATREKRAGRRTEETVGRCLAGGVETIFTTLTERYSTTVQYKCN
jgi:hypothetical protein